MNQQAQFEDCPDCPGQLIVGKFSPITVREVDIETGEIRPVTYQLQQHRARIVFSGPSTVLERKRDGTIITLGDAGEGEFGRALPDVPHSVFDPTGLVWTPCSHGLPEHPSGFTDRRPGGSWVRMKYRIGNPNGCVVCKGQPRPDDLTTPRA